MNLSKSEKSSSYSENASFDHEKVESGGGGNVAASSNGANAENVNSKVDSKEQSISSSSGTPSGDKQAPQMKVTKKKSKLCLLL